MYLYGEYCLLEALGFEAFQRRHTEEQLRTLAAQLAPLQLWPTATGGPAQAAAPIGAGTDLELVARTLAQPPLRLGLGVDLFRACLAWAGSQGDTQADPGAWFEPSRSVLAEQLGFMPPSLRVQLDDGVPAHAYRLYVWGEAVVEGEAFPGQDMMRAGPEDVPPALPYPWTRDPAGPGWVTWLPIGPGAMPPAHLERIHWIAAMNRHVTAVVPRFADRLLTVPMLHAMLEQAETVGYDHELERYVSVPELRLVFQALIRQGLRLEPPVMLEKLLTSILADLSGRSLSPSELERIARQLPVFPTSRLVGIVRKGLGLPESPPGELPRVGAPMPAPQEQPTVDDAAAAHWRELRALAHQHRPEAVVWVNVLRAMVPPTWRRSGYGLNWSLFAPREPVVVPPPPDLAAALIASGRLPAIQRLVVRQLELVDRLDELGGWLAEGPSRRLSAPAIAMATTPTWPDYHWLLAAPGRALDELGVRAWAETAGFLPSRSAAEGI